MKDKIKIIPLGGVAEIGKNMMVYEYDEKILIVDCGVMFPDEEHPGVDLIIPDFTYLRENRDKIVGIASRTVTRITSGRWAISSRNFPKSRFIRRRSRSES